MCIISINAILKPVHVKKDVSSSGSGSTTRELGFRVSILCPVVPY